MTEIIFTYRPFRWIKPISWINRITRKISRAPYDHVAIKKDGVIYESTTGKGVRSIGYSDWKKGREGTYLFIYTAPDDAVDLIFFKQFEGRGYDYQSAINHFFHRKEAMAKRSYKKFTCSEFVALCMHMYDHWKALPRDVERECEMKNYPLNKVQL